MTSAASPIGEPSAPARQPARPPPLALPLNPKHAGCSDPESNYGGAHKVLLQQVPIPGAQVHAINDALCATNEGAAGPAAEDYDARLKALPEAVLPCAPHRARPHPPQTYT